MLSLFGGKKLKVRKTEVEKLSEPIKVYNFEVEDWHTYYVSDTDQIYNFIADYMEGIITREQFWVMAKFKYPTHQINFCTEEALKCLKYRDCQEVLK